MKIKSIRFMFLPCFMIVWANVRKNRGIQHENTKKGHSQIGIITEEHHLTRPERGRHINQTLIATAPEK